MFLLTQKIIMCLYVAFENKREIAVMELLLNNLLSKDSFKPSFQSCSVGYDFLIVLLSRTVKLLRRIIRHIIKKVLRWLQKSVGQCETWQNIEFNWSYWFNWFLGKRKSLVFENLQVILNDFFLESYILLQSAWCPLLRNLGLSWSKIQMFDCFFLSILMFSPVFFIS